MTPVGWSFVRCVLGFFMGVLAYQVYNRYRSKISEWSGRIAFCLLAILVVFMSFSNNAELDGIFILPIFFGLIVAVAAEPAGGGISKFMNLAPMRWLGRVSYSIYLTHLMVLMFVSRCFDLTQKHFNPDHRDGLGLAFVFLAVAVVLTISQLTYQWIERPYQNEFKELAAKRFNPWKSHA